MEQPCTASHLRSRFLSFYDHFYVTLLLLLGPKIKVGEDCGRYKVQVIVHLVVFVKKKYEFNMQSLRTFPLPGRYIDGRIISARCGCWHEIFSCSLLSLRLEKIDDGDWYIRYYQQCLHSPRYARKDDVILSFTTFRS